MGVQCRAALTALYSQLVQQRSNIREQVKRNIHDFAAQPHSAALSDSSDDESSEDEEAGDTSASAKPKRTRCSYETVMEKLADLEKEYEEDAQTLEDELYALKTDLQTYAILPLPNHCSSPK